MQKIINLFSKPIIIYYDCLDKQQYVTIKIIKMLIGGKLSIGNGIYITENCRKVGLLISQGSVYSYVVFKYGYLLFGGSQKQTHFGFCLFKSKTEKSNKEISTFCSYVPFTKQNIKEKIQLLKYN